MEASRVVVLGLARQGKALARYFSERGARVVVSDLRPEVELTAEMAELVDPSVEFILGGHPPELLEGADLLCLSGGVPADLPLARQARLHGIRVTNDAQLFLEACPAPVIGITGSAGKTTTTELVGRMARAAAHDPDRSVWVGGNIGRPLISDLNQIRPRDFVVMELSSFQLELMTHSPQLAAILNLTPNHLDRHGSMQAYTAAKSNILAHQMSSDVAVLGRDDPGAWALRDQVRGRRITFGVRPSPEPGTFVEDGELRLQLAGGSRGLFPLEAIGLRGTHNLLNVLGACAIAAAAEIEPEAMRAGVEGFTGVEHRLEFVRRVREADWYNDSIATAPERTAAAIRSFSEPIVLLLGGRDKGLPWDELIRLIHDRVDHLVLFGELGPMVERALGEGRRGEHTPSIAVVTGLDAAVAAAAQVASPGDVVLLAPGGTSYDQFVDFAARGERFKQLVESL